jgi:predicted O-methyltransferase YrrM
MNSSTNNDHAQLVLAASTLYGQKPAWVEGSLGSRDTQYLFSIAYHARAEAVVEIGTASGFSTAVLCHALERAKRDMLIGSQYLISSYDISNTYFGDRSKSVGLVAREQLPEALFRRIVFHHPTRAADIGQHHAPGSIQLLFIDANHSHPWPTLDLIAALPYLAPFATVVLHDINLPLINEQFPDWGAKYLFDDLQTVKQVSEETGQLPNIGSFTVPDDRDVIRAQLLGILSAHPWQTKVDEAYLQRIGPDIVSCKA